MGRVVVASAVAAVLERLEGRQLFSAGAVDPTFGTAGSIVLTGGGEFNDAVVAVDAKGRELVGFSYGGVHGGDAYVTRLNPNGSTDTTFGTGGVVDLGTGPDTVDYPNEGGVHVGQVIPLANGNILVVGTTIQELTSTGAPDTAFGGGGPGDDGKGSGYLYPAAGDDAAAVLPGGQILTDEADGYGTIILSRYDADGSVDTTYGTAGQLSVSPAPAGSTRVLDGPITLDAAGRPVVSFEAIEPSGVGVDGLVRLATAGRVDTTFGTAGVALSPTSAAVGGTFGGNVGGPTAVAPDGTVYQAVSSTTPAGTAVSFLFAYSADGTHVAAGVVTGVGVDGVTVGADDKPVVTTSDGRVDRLLPLSPTAGTDVAVAYDPTFAASGSAAIPYPTVADFHEQGGPATFSAEDVVYDASGNLLVTSSADVAATVTRVLTAGPSSVAADVFYGTAEIGTAGSWHSVGNTLAKAFDQNLSSFYDGHDATGDWAGLNLGSAVAPVQVRFAPRAGYEGRMVGGQFQVSSTATFSSDVHTIYTVTTKPTAGQLTTVAVGDVGAYPYFRYIGPAGGECNVAEVQVLIAGYAPIAGTAIGTAGSYQNRGDTLANAFDGSTSTFVDAPVAGGAYVGEDFGTATGVYQVRLAPRAGYAGRMVGGQIQASDSATFSDPIDVYTIETAPPAGTLTDLSLSPEVGAHRYWRYVGPAGGYDNIAELEFDN